MSAYLTSLLTPGNVAAAADLPADDLAALSTLCRRFAARQAGDRVNAEDVAAVATLQAAGMLAAGHGPSTAAAAAVRVAVVAALRDADGNGGAESSSVPLEATEDDNGAPLLRLASPYAPDPAAPYRTTTTDLYRDALAALPAGDAPVAAALLSEDGKGGKVPAAAVRRALGLAPVTGRAGTAWTATLTEDAARILPALQDCYRDALTLAAQGCEGWEPVRTYGAPRTARRIDRAALTADRAAKVRPADDARREQDARRSSGPASRPAVWDRRAADRLGILAGGARRRATEDDKRAALAPSQSLTLPAYSPGAARAAEERRVLAFDVEAASLPTGARIPGVSVDADGVAVAGAGVANRGSGSGKAAPRHTAPRKASRTGGTGATVPVGPRR